MVYMGIVLFSSFLILSTLCVLLLLLLLFYIYSCSIYSSVYSNVDEIKKMGVMGAE